MRLEVNTIFLTNCSRAHATRHTGSLAARLAPAAQDLAVPHAHLAERVAVEERGEFAEALTHVGHRSHQLELAEAARAEEERGRR